MTTRLGFYHGDVENIEILKAWAMVRAMLLKDLAGGPVGLMLLLTVTEASKEKPSHVVHRSIPDLAVKAATTFALKVVPFASFHCLFIYLFKVGCFPRLFYYVTANFKLIAFVILCTCHWFFFLGFYCLVYV